MTVIIGTPKKRRGRLWNGFLVNLSCGPVQVVAEDPRGAGSRRHIHCSSFGRSIITGPVLCPPLPVLPALVSKSKSEALMFVFEVHM